MKEPLPVPRYLSGRNACWIIERARHILLQEGFRSLGRKLVAALSNVASRERSAFPLAGQSLEEQYEIWRAQQLTINRETTIEFDSVTPAYQPLVSFIIVCAESDGVSFRQTMESIAQQEYRSLEIIATCHPASIDVVREVLSQLLDRTAKLFLVEGRDGEHIRTGVAASSGEFVWVMKSQDQLAPAAISAVVRSLDRNRSADILYVDEEIMVEGGGGPIPFFKPSWSPELFLSTNYLSRAVLFRRAILLDAIKHTEQSEDVTLYDYALWATESTKNILHIPRILYHSWRNSNLSSGVEHPTSDGHLNEEKRSLKRALMRKEGQATVEEARGGGFHIRYQLKPEPLVSILIPSRDRPTLLSQCIGSIERHTTYPRYEIIVLDNGSEQELSKEYLREISERWRVISCPGAFNFSAMNNRGRSEANGAYVLFLNDDTEVLIPDWLTIMTEQASRKGVGAVGAKLLYPNGRIQHAGVMLGVKGVAGHAFRHTLDTDWGYHGLAHLTRNCSAVTAACMMVSRDVLIDVNGFDEQLTVEFNDVDLCLRIRERGYRIVYVPHAVLYHHENATRQGRRSPQDEAVFLERWGDLIAKGDPYYNPNLTMRREDWSLDV